MGDYIIKTKFVPPGSNRKYWEKSKLWEQYGKISNYPVTVVRAGPGYGKSTTIAAFFRDKDHCYWYNADEMDADPAVFLLNLLSAFHWKNENIAGDAIAALTETSDPSGHFMRITSSFINDLEDNLKTDTYLIIDDFHLVAGNKQILELMAHFIKMMPAQLHLVLLTREKLGFREWAAWRLKKVVQVYDERNLMLDSEEIASFFAEQYGFSISREDAERVQRESEGWIIALDLLGQGLTHGAKLEEVLDAEADSLDLLFEYLAYEVLESQSAQVQEFMIKTSVLKNLRSDICNQLLGVENSGDILAEMINKGFFIFVLTPGQYRYHHLVREFLLKICKEKYDPETLHRRASEICLDLGEMGLAIYHSLEARDYEQAASLIVSSADHLLQLGRLDSLQTYLDELPEAIYSQYPELFIYQGEVWRLKSMFNQALKVFEQARQVFLDREELLNVSRVSQKIALVYLDTVQPVKANEYLQEALRYRDKENLWEEAALLKLMAENKANEGQLDQAEALQRRAQHLDKQEISDSNIRARVLLRTGKLEEAARLLESKLADEEQRDILPRSHRETILILSLIHSLRGEVELAYSRASAGVELGEQLHSPFIIAVAYMRLGHSLQLERDPKLEEARQAYQESLKLVDDIEIARGRAEPLLGLALLEGFHGDSNLGLKYGREGLSIAEQSGDQWLSGMLKISIGINRFFLEELDKAAEIFRSARNDFRECKDPFCQLASELWLSLAYRQAGQAKNYDRMLEETFMNAESTDCHCLFSTPTLLGVRDLNMIAPLLLDASRKFSDSKLLQGIVAEQGLANLDYHPGYSLKITSLGNLRVWRGKEEIGSKEWQREKALELFLLLVVNRGRFLPKETIQFSLWPDDDEETAARNFKVTLNALKKALEPDRKAQEESFFVLRNRSNYGFNQDAGYSFDVEDFERLLAKGDREKNKRRQSEHYREAIKLYQGDFLADFLYIDWIEEERERLRTLFLNTVDKLARYYYLIDDNDEALQMADLLLEHDPCWEPAYLLKMKIYHRLNRPFVAAKVYEQCKTVLDRELNVTPMPEIEKYYQKLRSEL
ncbi:MAG: BTAD domain-containing putative transcriptional regulator [Bacillota bacterium]|nr:BTAD domain-containing putative transcriptional regulator [Bacillota bacterium]